MSDTNTSVECRRHVRYGMTCEEFADLRSRASDACEICGVTGKDLAIDHDHKGGWSSVRGLLCHKCNMRLGRVEAGTVEVNEKQAAYLAGAWYLSHPDRPVIRQRERPIRSIRIDPQLWEDAHQASRAIGVSLPTLIGQLLKEYVDDVYWRTRYLKAEAELKAIKGEQ